MAQALHGNALFLQNETVKREVFSLVGADMDQSLPAKHRDLSAVLLTL